GQHPIALRAESLYRPEWQYNLGARTDAPPALGIALSGGGMRAATFTLGVLHGLAKLEILEKVDAISSVSGGGYALSWYYVQNTEKIENDRAVPINAAELFDLHSRYQTYIANHGELIGSAPAEVVYLRRAQYLLFDIPVTLASMPV